MQTLQDWPRNEAFSFTMPPHLMSMSINEIRDTILRIYREWRLKYSPIEYFPWGELAHGIEWRWWDKKKLALPRRIAAVLYDRYKYKLGAKFWGELGNMLRERIPVSAENIIRLTTDFSWKSGAYGDHGSCMWDGRAATRKAMSESGKFMALQFFADHSVHEPNETEIVEVNGNKYYSLARCWVYPTEVTLKGKDEYVVLVFNAYGGIPLASMATIIQALIEADGSKQISVSNNGRTSGGIYVNGSQGRLCGSELALKLINHMDFSFKNNYDGHANHLRRRGDVILSTTGAIINAREAPSFGHEVTSKPKRFNSYEKQKRQREELRKSYLKSKFNKYASTAKVPTEHQWIVMMSDRIVKNKPTKPIKFIPQNQFIRERVKQQFGYRGSTRSEAHMFDQHRSRLSNITGWAPTLEMEFPRWTAAQRQGFSRSIVRHNYSLWSYITHNLSQLIKEE